MKNKTIFDLLHDLDEVKTSNKGVNAPHYLNSSPCGCRREQTEGGCRDTAFSESWGFQKVVTLPSGARVRLRKYLWLHRECGQILDTERKLVLTVGDLLESDYTPHKPGTTGPLPALDEQPTTNTVETLEQLLDGATGLNPMDVSETPLDLVYAGAD